MVANSVTGNGTGKRKGRPKGGGNRRSKNASAFKNHDVISNRAGVEDDGTKFTESERRTIKALHDRIKEDQERKDRRDRELRKKHADLLNEIEQESLVELDSKTDPSVDQKIIWMQPEQFATHMAVLNLDAEDLEYLFGYAQSDITAMTDGKQDVPGGLADYLRLKVSTKMKDLGHKLGIPITVDTELAPQSLPNEYEALMGLVDAGVSFTQYSAFIRPAVRTRVREVLKRQRDKLKIRQERAEKTQRRHKQKQTLANTGKDHTGEDVFDLASSPVTPITANPAKPASNAKTDEPTSPYKDMTYQSFKTGRTVSVEE